MKPFIASLFCSLALAPLSLAQAQLFKKRPPTPSPPPAHQMLGMPPSGNPYANLGAGLVAAPVEPFPAPALPETVVYHRSATFSPSYQLPYEGYRYQRHGGRSRGGLIGSGGKPSPGMLELLEVIRKRAEAISAFGLPYVFGGDHPGEGGLDCSGAMKYLLSDIGFRDMPRTSFDQYAWLREARTLRHTKSIPEQMGGRKGIKPGDLIFWGGTYNSGHKVSHVMIYLGQGRDGTHYMFGARGQKKTGLNGSGVDIFKLESGYQKGLIGFGTLPGVS